MLSRMDRNLPQYWIDRIGALAERVRKATSDQELAALIEEYEGVVQNVKDQLGTTALDESLELITECKPAMRRRLC